MLFSVTCWPRSCPSGAGGLKLSLGSAEALGGGLQQRRGLELLPRCVAGGPARLRGWQEGRRASPEVFLREGAERSRHRAAALTLPLLLAGSTQRLSLTFKRGKSDAGQRKIILVTASVCRPRSRPSVQGSCSPPAAVVCCQPRREVASRPGRAGPGLPPLAPGRLSSPTCPRPQGLPQGSRAEPAASTRPGGSLPRPFPRGPPRVRIPRGAAQEALLTPRAPLPAGGGAAPLSRPRAEGTRPAELFRAPAAAVAFVGGAALFVHLRGEPRATWCRLLPPPPPPRCRPLPGDRPTCPRRASPAPAGGGGELGEGWRPCHWSAAAANRRRREIAVRERKALSRWRHRRSGTLGRGMESRGAGR